MQLTHPILIFWLTSAYISGNLVSLLLHRCPGWAPKSGSTGSALVLSLKLTPQRLPCDPGDLVPNPWMNPRNQLTTVNSEMIIDWQWWIHMCIYNISIYKLYTRMVNMYIYIYNMSCYVIYPFGDDHPSISLPRLVSWFTLGLRVPWSNGRAQVAAPQTAWPGL